MKVLHIIEYLTKTCTFVEEQIFDSGKHKSELLSVFGYDKQYFPNLSDVTYNALEAELWRKLKLNPRTMTGYIKSNKRYSEKINNINPDIIHCHFAPIAYYHLRTYKPKIPIVVTLYGYDVYQCLKLKRNLSKYRYIFDNVRKIICVSKKMVVDIRKLGFDKYSFEYIPVSVDISKFHNRNRILENRNKFKILHISGLTEKKGVEYMIYAARILKRDNISFEMIIVGSGDRKSKLMQLASTLGLENCVRFIEHIPHDNLLSTYQDVDLFVHPGIVDKWGDEDIIPQTIKEALSCGLPVIATTVGAASEAVIDGWNGFIIPPKDPDKLAHRIRQLIENRSLLSRLSCNASETTKENYNLEYERKKIIEIYERMNGDA